ADCTEIPQADLVSGKGFLGNMTENLQADCVQSRQAGFIQRFLYIISYLLALFKCHTGLVKNSFFSGSLTSRYFYDMIGATSKPYNLCTILKSIPHILQNVFQIP
ncbi:hypothetical protein, partial [Ruminococcus sp.]